MYLILVVLVRFYMNLPELINLFELIRLHSDFVRVSDIIFIEFN